MRLRDLRWARLVKYGTALLSFAFVVGALIVWSGFYNVAASSSHWSVMTWLLEQVRVQSVEMRGAFVDEPPPLDNVELIKLGAAHFEGGCTPCHSRPGQPPNAIVMSMVPPPPPLSRAVKNNDAGEIFWIVKHGLKFTAMPAWPSQARDDEVWALTAFLKRLPELSQNAYHKLSGATRVGGERRSSQELAQSSESVALTQCVRCHGDASTSPLSNLVPVLNIQSPAYLERALVEYAAGTRPSGIMQPVADLLDPNERRRIAAWYAGLNSPPLQSLVEPGEVARGRELAVNGDPGRSVPPCLACHSEQNPDSFPSLAGQNAPYLLNQLHLFRSGGRDDTGYSQIMAVVAERLTKDQVRYAAAYFASLPPGGATANPEAVR